MTRDTRLLERAVTQRWPVQPAFKDAAVKQLVKVIADPESSPREKTSAARALTAMEAQNQADEHKQEDDFASRLIAIANGLGIDLSALGIVEASPARAIGDDRETTKAKE